MSENKIKCYEDYVNCRYKMHISNIEEFETYKENYFVSEKLYNAINADKKIEFNGLFNECTFEFMRNEIYVIYINAIQCNDVLLELAMELIEMNKIEQKLLTQIIMIITNYDQALSKGSRSIIHIESCISNILYHIINE